ncbi:MAG TPA: toll/interleukin-1 receptor domain-containing protein [Ktedonobacteraceae bacterium]|nr:toll/interleukin-1 receptor domain-containing protein [Ktedonobacteraceae bacterium]
MSNVLTPIEIFCSYADEDDALFRKLEKHLGLLKQRGLITLWHNRLPLPGTNWAQDVDAHINSASVILLLISANFLASDYCYGTEMQHALQQGKTGKARVIPILLSSVDYQDAPFEKLKVLPSNGKPVTEWSSSNRAFTNVAQGIRQTIEELIYTSKSTSSDSFSTIWNIPYARNHFFTGREEFINLLHEKLIKDGNSDTKDTHAAACIQRQAIKGLGGIGKTQIAIEYAYRYRESYAVILWVNAATEETLISSFADIAEMLPSLLVKDETDQKKIVAAVKHWLEQCHEHWLLIFDNADDISLVRDFLPNTGNGHTLLTTRAYAVSAIAASIEVEKMGLLEGSCLLLRRAYSLANSSDKDVLKQISDEDVNEAGNIVSDLDALPLALDQAGAYIEETQCSLSHYLELYRTHRTQLLARRGVESSNYPLTVETTWSLAFQRVEQANTAAAQLLQLCAFLAPDAILEELIMEAASRWSSPLREAATDLFLLDQMIDSLLKFSLVKRSKETGTLSIHRLVQAVLIDKMDQQTQSQWAKQVLLAVNDLFPSNTDNVALWPQCQRYLSQVQVCSTLIEGYSLMFIEAANLLNRAGLYMYRHALYAIVEPLFRRALAISEEILGIETSDTATLLNNLAGLYNKQGKYGQAELLYQRALQISEQHLGTEHPNTACTLNNLAGLYENLGKYEQAEPLCKRALQISEQQLGIEHPDTARCLDNLANIYESQGKYEQAEPLYQRALQIFERQLGIEHPTTISCLNNLANLYEGLGKYEQAEPLYQQVLQLFERQFGTEHLNTALSLNNLACLYYDQGKYAAAKPLYQRALSIYKVQLGDNHPETLKIQKNVALFLQTDEV